jgi:primosomal protein N' (replication factor Y) (superfamily II helicase)
VICAALDADAAHGAADALRAGIDAAFAAHEAGRAGDEAGRFAILGPAPLFMLRGKSRYQMVVKAGDRAAAVSAVRDAVDSVSGDRAHREVALSVDVDPQ